MTAPAISGAAVTVPPLFAVGVIGTYSHLSVVTSVVAGGVSSPPPQANAEQQISASPVARIRAA